MKNIYDNLLDFRARRIEWTSLLVGILLGMAIPAILLLVGFNAMSLVLVGLIALVVGKYFHAQLPLKSGGN